VWPVIRCGPHRRRDRRRCDCSVLGPELLGCEFLAFRVLGGRVDVVGPGPVLGPGFLGREFLGFGLLARRGRWARAGTDARPSSLGDGAVATRDRRGVASVDTVCHTRRPARVLARHGAEDCGCAVRRAGRFRRALGGRVHGWGQRERRDAHHREPQALRKAGRGRGARGDGRRAGRAHDRATGPSHAQCAARIYCAVPGPGNLRGVCRLTVDSWTRPL
jgi:hypothetical protein